MDPQVQIFYLNFVREMWWKFRSANVSMGLVSTHGDTSELKVSQNPDGKAMVSSLWEAM